ncbi:uncharacterized protein LOC127104903 [Lathyrus oleraceus]|uniref:uncharacterized protein LOC127104903 n=1 Tax=Pisum sativum TaxID=3888 RepID=UPI0021CEF561|nr:uncharacterized protein LOC127104903 [Pisum sativum]
MKKVKLQSLCKQYGNLSMKNNEKVSDYISIVILITNEMKSYGEILSEESIVEKVLRSLTPQFDYIRVEIEHSKDLSTMRIEKLQSSLETQKLRLTERNSEMEVEHQALKAASSKKYHKQSWSRARKRSDGVQKSKTLTFKREKNAQKRKEKYDKKKVLCYCCKKFGHFAVDCWSNKEMKPEEAIVDRGHYDDESMILMASICDDTYLAYW